LLGGAAYHVTKVEYIVNPKLVEKFKAYRLKLAGHLDWEKTKPILAFHGTAEANIDNIAKNNFDYSKIGASTGNMGYYGKGIYFSEKTSYSIGYVKNCSKILLCQVLLGHCYETGYNMGCSLQEGYDSHIST
jgi:hypothetical protein